MKIYITIFLALLLFGCEQKPGTNQKDSSVPDTNEPQNNANSTTWKPPEPDYSQKLALLEDLKQQVRNRKSQKPQPILPKPQPKPSLPKRNNETEIVWLDDELPKGATSQDWHGDWVEDRVISGKKSLKGSGNDHFYDANPPLKVSQEDTLFTYAYIEPKDPPKRIMLQWNSENWHRAYWGEKVMEGVSKVFWAQNFLDSKYMGPLPKTGEWVRLEVKAEAIGLGTDTPIDGLAFTQTGETSVTREGVYWDKAGVFKKSATATTTKKVSEWEKRFLLWSKNPKPFGGSETLDKIKEAKESKIDTLRLGKTGIKDLNPLAELTDVRLLFLNDNEITNIEPLSNLTSLIRLSLHSNKIKNLHPLTKLTNLEELHLMDNEISDISPLSGLTKLKDLQIYNNAIIDLKRLSQLTKLKTLQAGTNPLNGDIQFIAKMKDLNRLTLNNVKHFDLSPLHGMKNLKFLGLWDSEFSEKEIQELEKSLPGCHIAWSDKIDQTKNSNTKKTPKPEIEIDPKPKGLVKIIKITKKTISFTEVPKDKAELGTVVDVYSEEWPIVRVEVNVYGGGYLSGKIIKHYGNPKSLKVGDWVELKVVK